MNHSRRKFLGAAGLGIIVFGMSRMTGAAPINVDDYKAPIRVACVGDSITFGAGIANREVNSYPAQLGRMLGDKWEVRNFGVSGATLLTKGDLPYVKQRAYTDALAYKPDVVVIKLGTNDSKHQVPGGEKSPDNWTHKADFLPDYKDMIAAFKNANPQVKVFVCLPVPAFPGHWGINDTTIREEVNPLARQVAQDTGSTLIDLYSALNGDKRLFPDTVHPNAAGATLIAAEVYRALTGKEPPAADAAKK
jgi:lysophospholipase L1-like esterase